MTPELQYHKDNFYDHHDTHQGSQEKKYVIIIIHHHYCHLHTYIAIIL